MPKKSVVVFQVLYAILLSLGSKAQVKDTAQAALKFPDLGQISVTALTYKIIPSAEHTFCYDIFSDGKLMIHQPSKPGMAGNKGFKTEQEAILMANFVITKIKNGEMPPTVTEADMRQLKLLQ